MSQLARGYHMYKAANEQLHNNTEYLMFSVAWPPIYTHSRGAGVDFTDYKVNGV